MFVSNWDLHQLPAGSQTLNNFCRKFGHYLCIINDKNLSPRRRCPVSCPPSRHGVGQLMVTFCRGRSLLAVIFISLLGCVRPPQRQCVNSPEDSGTENALMFTCATWFVWLNFIEFYLHDEKGQTWNRRDLSIRMGILYAAAMQPRNKPRFVGCSQNADGLCTGLGCLGREQNHICWSRLLVCWGETFVRRCSPELK